MSSSHLWRRLERAVTALVFDFPGVAGVAVTSLNSTHRLQIRANEEFPTASSIKIHILAQLLLRAERGEVDLEERVRVTPEAHAAGSGVLTQMEDDVELTVADLATLMIIVSDNTATNICIDFAGMEETNSLVHGLGLKSTHLRRKMQDDEAVAQGRENVSTPAEMVGILERLHGGQPSPAVAKQSIEVLGKPKQGPLRAGIPADVPLANKTGGIENVRCDAGIVFLPRLPYAIAVMTKFVMRGPETAQSLITSIARLTHETMATLDTTTQLGRGIPGLLSDHT